MAKTIEYIVNIATKSAQKNVDDLNKSLDNTGEAMKDVEGLADNLTGGLVSRFKGVGKGIGGAIKGLKGFKVALISTGIGAIVVALGSFITFLGKTQKGLDLVSEVTAGFSAGLSVIIDRVSRLGEIFSNVFSQSFSKTLGDIKQNFSGINDEIAREVALASGLEAALNKLRKEEIGLIETNAKRRKGIAENQKLSVDENLTLEERISALDRASQLETDILNDQLRIAKERAKISQQQTDLGESTDEQLRENAELQANVYKLEEDSIKLQESLLSRRIALVNQEKSKRDAINNEAKSKKEREDAEAQKKEDDRLKALEDLEKNYEKRKQDREADTNLKKIELEEQRALADLERLGATLEQKKQLEDYYSTLKVEAAKTDAQNIDAINEKANQDAEAKRQQDLSNEIAKIDAENELRQAQFGLLAGFGNLLGQLAGENKELQIASIIAQQASSIGQIVSNTAAANAKAVAINPVSLGQPWVGINTASAALGIAGSVAAGAKAISQIKSSGKSSSAPSAPTLRRGAVGGGAGSLPPQFNAVGTSGINQLAQTIQAQAPIKAYVVSGDVTTAQSLDRNRVQEAGI